MTRLKVRDVQNYQIMYEQCYLCRGSRKLFDSRGHPSRCGFLTQILEGGAQSWPRRMRATGKRILLLSLLLLLSLYSAQTLRDEKSIRPGVSWRAGGDIPLRSAIIFSPPAAACVWRPTYRIASSYSFSETATTMLYKGCHNGRTISSSSKMLCSHKNRHCEY